MYKQTEEFMKSKLPPLLTGFRANHSTQQSPLSMIDIFKRYLKWSNKLYRIWKIQLKIEINFMSSKDNNEECVIHLRSDKIELMNNNKKMKL